MPVKQQFYHDTVTDQLLCLHFDDFMVDLAAIWQWTQQKRSLAAGEFFLPLPMH
jgi:hypothetical protein